MSSAMPIVARKERKPLPMAMLPNGIQIPILQTEDDSGDWFFRKVIPDDPFSCYDLFPLRSIRERCIKAMDDYPSDIPGRASWIEARITIAAEYLDYPMYHRLLSWYLHNCSSWHGLQRATRYAIEFTLEKDSGDPSYVHECSKDILSLFHSGFGGHFKSESLVGRVLSLREANRELYEFTQPLIERCLKQRNVCLDPVCRDWAVVARAARIVCRFKDVRHRRQIKVILKSYKQQQQIPNNSRKSGGDPPSFELVQRIAFLQSILAYLNT